MSTLVHAGVSAAEAAALRAAISSLRARFPIERVVLFGSKARGDAGAESDIDLLVVTARELAWQERHALLDALFDIQMTHDVVFSPLVVEREAWERGIYSVLPIRAEIERAGIVL